MAKCTVPIKTEYHDTRIIPVSFHTYGKYARESINTGERSALN